MKIIGLTGGIGSGKSTVGRVLDRMGVPVVDADQLARQAVELGTPAHAAIAARWPHVIQSDETIDRAALGRIVFSDVAQRRELTEIVLPRIKEELLRRRDELARRGHSLCVFEMATLFEENLEHTVDGVLLVTAPIEDQVRRAVARTGMSESDARARIAAQLGVDEKRARARWVLDNSSSEIDLERRVREVWARITTEA